MITSVVLSNYETIGVMPRVEIELASKHKESEAISLVKQLLKNDINCEITFNNGTAFYPEQVSIRTGVHKNGFFEYFFTFVYSLESISSVRYKFNYSVLSEANFEFYVHSSFDNFIWCNYMWSYNRYVITVDQKTYEHLGLPFEKYCHPANQIGHSNELNDFYFSCLVRCFKARAKNVFNCSLSKEDLYSLSNQSFVNRNSLDFADVCSEKIAWEVKSVMFLTERQCLEDCPYSCVEWQHKIKTRSFRDLKLNNAVEVSIEFARNDFAIIFKAKPRMTLFDLFYETCSLASLWLGWAIIDFLFNSINLLKLFIKNILNK